MADPKPRRIYSKSGLNTLKADVSRRKGRTKVRLLFDKRLDLRIPAARALVSERDAWIEDMGGPEAISAKQMTLLDAALRTNLYVQHLDSFLMQQASLVNFKKRSVIPVLRERQVLVDSLARILSMLGLERKERSALTLEDYAEVVAQRKAAQAEGGVPSE